jgi:hypothetical protein
MNTNLTTIRTITQVSDQVVSFTVKHAAAFASRIVRERAVLDGQGSSKVKHTAALMVGRIARKGIVGEGQGAIKGKHTTTKEGHIARERAVLDGQVAIVLHAAAICIGRIAREGTGSDGQNAAVPYAATTLARVLFWMVRTPPLNTPPPLPPM